MAPDLKHRLPSILSFPIKKQPPLTIDGSVRTTCPSRLRPVSPSCWEAARNLTLSPRPLFTNSGNSILLFCPSEFREPSIKSNCAVGASGSITSACLVPNINLSIEIVRTSISTSKILRTDVPPAKGLILEYPLPLKAADSVMKEVLPAALKLLNPPFPA